MFNDNVVNKVDKIASKNPLKAARLCRTTRRNRHSE